MIRAPLAIACTLLLAACSPTPTDTAATAAEDAPAEAAAEAIPADTVSAETPASAADTFAARFDGVLAGTWRSPENRARDQYRHPRETLSFFGIAPGQTVIEITPGGGWYAEILTPLLNGQGAYVAAVMDPASASNDRQKDNLAKGNDELREKFSADAATYGDAQVREFAIRQPSFGPDGSADLLLTFRNVHNWRSVGTAEAMFAGFFKVLKPGGTLGVVEHRAKQDVPADDESGYVGEAQVIAMAQAAGFSLVEKSEINANPQDTKDHPKGVWTLPPVLALEEQDKAKYLAIGESDRMTLKFVKPQ